MSELSLVINALPFVLVFWVPTMLVVFLVAAWLAARRRDRILEMVHAERKLAIEKGVPPPELPTFPVHGFHHRPVDPRRLLVGGVVALFTGTGIIAAFAVALPGAWPFGMIVLFMGAGMLHAYGLIKDKR